MCPNDSEQGQAPTPRHAETSRDPPLLQRPPSLLQEKQKHQRTNSTSATLGDPCGDSSWPRKLDLTAGPARNSQIMTFQLYRVNAEFWKALRMQRGLCSPHYALQTAVYPLYCNQD